MRRRSKARVSWEHMIQRCTNPNNDDFARYGGRGIRVCDRWASSAAFLADMGERPAGKCLDRIDNDGDYQPGNCRWADLFEQNGNRSNSRLMTWRGRVQCLAVWARELGMKEDTLRRRALAGWSDRRALSTPVRRYRERNRSGFQTQERRALEA